MIFLACFVHMCDTTELSFFFLENGLKSGLYIHNGCTQPTTELSISDRVKHFRHDERVKHFRRVFLPAPMPVKHMLIAASL